MTMAEGDEFEFILPSALARRDRGGDAKGAEQEDAFEAALESIVPTKKSSILRFSAVSFTEEPVATSSSEDDDESADLSAAADGDIDGSAWPGTPFRVRKERAHPSVSAQGGTATIGTDTETTLFLYWLRTVAPWWRQAVAKFLDSARPREEEGSWHTVIIFGFPLVLMLGMAAIIALAETSASGGMGVVGTGAWIGVAAVVGCSIACLLLQKREKWDPFWTVFVAWVAFAAALLVLPAAITMSGTASMGLLGALVFLGEIWLAGWFLLWYRAPSLGWVAERQCLLTVPSTGGFGLRLKPITVAIECLNYAGCSFVPAVPWGAVTAPLGLPSFSSIMLASFFEQAATDSIGDSEAAAASPGHRHWTFQAALAAVPLGFVLVFLSRGDKGHYLVAILICFDLLTFPLLKRITSVLACTPDSVWVFETPPGGRMLSNTAALVQWSMSAEEQQCCGDGVLHRSCSVADDCTPERRLGSVARSFCQLDTETELDAVGERYCMNNDPTVPCWEQTHLQLLVVSACLLVPYYFATLALQSLVQAQQSVVVVDGSWTFLATQSKLFLAVAASAFGDCYPITVICCVAATMLVQLLFGVTYSSVLTINSVRVGGMLCGLFSSAAAAFVLFRVGRPAGESTCSSAGDLLAAVLHATAGLTAEQPTVQGDWLPLVVAMSANALAIVMGLLWLGCKRSTWGESAKSYSWASINDEVAFETDYPILAQRLKSLTALVSDEIDRVDAQSGSGQRQQRGKGAADSRAVKSLALERGLYCERRRQQLESSLPSDAEAAAVGGGGGGAAADGNGWLLDVYLREANDQQLERTTLEMVLSNELLSFPLGINLRDLDVTAPSGAMALRFFRRYSSESRFRKQLPAGRIAALQVTNVGTAETAARFSTHLRALSLLGLTELDLSRNRLGDEAMRRMLDCIKHADIELVSLDVSGCNCRVTAAISALCAQLEK